MEDSLAVALDFGTTSVKGGVLDSAGNLAAVFAEPSPVVRQAGNRFESSAQEYLELCTELLSRCLANALGTPPLGLSHQRSSFVVWEKSSGRALTPLISWQDSRAQETCRRLGAYKIKLREKTGLWLTPYFFAPKARHLLDEAPELKVGLQVGKLLIGTLDSFLIWHWTDGMIFTTDLSMAARTLLVDPVEQNWNADLLALFDVSSNWLPRVAKSELMGLRLKQQVVLEASVADQSAALLGAIGDKVGKILINLGTGGFLCCYIEDSFPIENMEGYQKTLVYQDANGVAHFAVEATINSIGRVLSSYACETGELVESKMLAEHYCTVEPNGLGAPFFREDIKLTFSKSIEYIESAQLAGLILEGVVFRIKQVIDDFKRMFDVDAAFLAGGWSRLPALNQGIAQCSPVNVYLLEEKECSLLGAALLAAGRIDHYGSKFVKAERNAEMDYLTRKYHGWLAWINSIVKRV